MTIFNESESYRPFFYPFAIETAKKQVIDMTWDVHQIELQDDLRQYNSKDGLATKTRSHAQNKELIDSLSLLFTEMDRTVAQGYTQIIPYVKNNEALTAFITFAFKETVHQRAYALAAESFGFSDADWIAFKSYKEMRDKLEVMSESSADLSTRLGFCQKLTQIALSEGIGLFAAFTEFLNLKRFGLLMGFNDVNQWSLADETGHVEFNFKIIQSEAKLLSYVEQLELQAYTEKLVEQFVQVEKNYVDLIGDQEDLPAEQVKKYMEYLGLLRLYQLGYRTHKEVPENPLDWMDYMLSAAKHENFFEKRVTSYSHQPLIGELDTSKYISMLSNRVIKYS